VAKIELDNVTKRFGDGTLAVRDASFTVGDGEFFILVGPSGCGKSTLLNMIVGLETPTEGEIRVDGRRVNELDPKDRNMAMVFQSYALYPHMTVRGNLAFPLTVAGLDRGEIERRVARAAALLELELLLDRRPAALSGGQRQRVAMGRAIVRDPVAFLLDEPLSNLDARLRAQMRGEIARLQKQLKTTTIFVTHDQAEAMTLGDRVAVLRDGGVQQVGTPREIYEMPQNLFVASFLGTPGMNLMPARVERDRLVLPIGEVAIGPQPLEAAAAHAASLIAGIRPEHLRERAGAHASGARVTAAVELVEWLGAEAFVHFAVADPQWTGAEVTAEPGVPRDGRGRIPMVARVDAASDSAVGGEIELTVDPGAVHLFDGATGERVS
jgi:multiple sugar transport system ATP-binding protein